MLVFEAWHLLVLLALFGLWAWSLFDAVRFTDNVWRAAGQTKVLIVVLIVIFGPLGSILYLTAVRPSLKRSVGGRPAT